MDRVTKPQKKMLISMLKETKYMEGKKEKEWYWEKIQAALNMIGPKKTIIQWKKCWRDMRLTTRKKLAEIKRCQISGGSPPPGVELTHEDNDIIDIVGAEYFYEEINGDVKPTEHFLTGFEYVPEQFCDAILSGSKEAPGSSHDTIDVDGERRSASTSHTTNDTRTPPLIGFASTSNNAGGHPSAAAVVHQQLKRNREEFAEHRESHFDDKLIRLLHETFAVKRERRLRNRDPDKLFLLSLSDEFKKIPDMYKLDVKTELIQVLNKWQKKSEKTRNNGQKHQQDSKPQTAGNPRLAMPPDQHTSMPAPHPPQHLQHNMYQFQKYENDKNVKPEQPANEKQQSMHSTQSQPAQNRDSGEPQHMSSQQVQHQQTQMSHNLYQLQKKYDDNSDKNTVPLQNSKDQHKQHVEHHQQQHQHPHHHQTEQHPPSPSSTTLLQHPHPHSVMFPIQTIRNEQQSQHPHSQHSQQHHPPPLFNTNPSTMSNNSM